MNPFDRMSIYYAQFSSTERKTCDLVINDPQVVVDNAIADAAKIYNVSPSSLLRMAKRMGYKGYSEFRYALENSQEQNKKNINSSHILSIVESYKTSLDNIDSYLDENMIKEFVDEFKTHRIFTIGIGNSSLPAKQLTYVLYTNGIWSDSVSNNTQLRYLAECVTKDDLLVIFSVTGSIDTYKEYLQKFKKKKCKIAMVTMNDSEELKPYIDYYFLLPMLSVCNLEEKQSFYPDNRCIFHIFVDIIMSYYLNQKKI